MADQVVRDGERKLVSISVGGPHSAIVNAAVEEMVALGIPVVAAAGNEGEDASKAGPIVYSHTCSLNLRLN